MSRVADLHTHTIHSDGDYTPHELVDRAIAEGIGILAISDHDNTEAITEVAEYAKERGLLLIAAAELSCQYEGIDVHVLAYGVELDHCDLNQRLASFRATRDRRGELMVERLASNGVTISIDRVRELAGNGSLGRPHVAKALIEVGAVASVDDAFREYLREGRPGWVDKERFEIEEAVDLVHRAGGLTSIAHPSLYPDHRRIVPRLLEAGIDGIEVMHPDVGGDDRHHYVRLAAELGKTTTGGSDDHGQGGRKTIGRIRVPESMIGPILERAS
jgi:predicted metal-dependent phosphoesterase TrpH